MENLVLLVDLGFDHVGIVCCFKFPVILHLFVDIMPVCVDMRMS